MVWQLSDFQDHCFTNLRPLKISKTSSTEDVLEYWLRAKFKRNDPSVCEVAFSDLLLERANLLRKGRCLSLSVEAFLDGRLALDGFAVSIFKDECGNVGGSTWGEAVYPSSDVALTLSPNLELHSTEDLMESYLAFDSDENVPTPYQLLLNRAIALRGEKMDQSRCLSLRRFAPRRFVNPFSRFVPQRCVILTAPTSPHSGDQICNAMTLHCDRQDRVTVYQRKKEVLRGITRTTEWSPVEESTGLAYSFNRFFIALGFAGKDRLHL